MDPVGLVEWDEDSRTITFHYVDEGVKEIHEYETAEQFAEALEFLLMDQGFAFYPDLPDSNN